MRLQIVCGLYAVLTTVIYGKDVRIIGGENAEIEEYPFMASIRFAIQNLIFCGGAIISNKHILTAAHCLYERRNVYHKIRIYTGITRTIAINGGVHEILHVYYHPEYTGSRSNESMNHHDIAVIEVKKEIEFTERQNLVALPNNYLNNYATGWIMGWGSTKYPVLMLSEQLQKAFMNVLPQNECVEKTPFKIHPEQFCGFFREGVDPCYGDGGGPMVIDNTIVGIISLHRPCAQGIPDIYTRVYSYLDFIRSIIGT